MSRVLVIGATGYIGREVALSLLRSGNYYVYGLARSEAKAKDLASLEIIPVIGSATDTAPITTAIRDDHIDVVVMCGPDGNDAQLILDAVQAAGEQRLEAAKNAGVPTAKLGLVYTSGTWVHGSSLDPVNDLDIVGHPSAKHQPPKLVNWRSGFEQRVLSFSPTMNVAVVRSGLVYGGPGYIWSLFFPQIMEAVKRGDQVLKLPIDEDSMPGLVHFHDVASGIHALVDKLPLLAGTGVYPIFDLQTSLENLGGLMKAAAKHLGFSGKIETVGVEGQNDFIQAINTSCNSNSGRAKALLGWEPKRIGMMARIDIYVKSWVAAQTERE